MRFLMPNLQLVESPLIIPNKSAVGLKPLASAVAIAMFSMAAAHAQALPPSCGTEGDSQTETQTMTVSSCTITSGGAIDVTEGDALRVSTGSEIATSISNAGRITGTTAIYVADTSATNSTNITNSGIIAGTNFAVNRAFAIPSQAVNITNHDKGQLIGNIVATDLRNISSSTVTLKSDVDLQDIENSGGSASAVLSGNFEGESGSTLRIAIVNTNVEGRDYSYLQAASAEVSGTLDVDVKAGSGLADGQEFYVVRASNMTTQFTEVTDNSAMFDFTQRLVEDQISDVGEGLYIDSVRVLSAFDASGRDAGRALDSGAPGLADVVSALGLLSTEQQVSEAVTQTQPMSGMSQATGNALKGSNNAIRTRQERQSGQSSGDALFEDQHAWAKPFGSWANQDDRNGVSGYEANTYGIVLGADAQVSDTDRLGVAFAYANTHVDGNSNSAAQSADVNSYQLVAYGSRSLSESTDINFQADIGVHANEGVRQIAFMSSTAKSDYTSWSAHVGTGLSHSYTLNEQTILTPSVRADYTRIRAGSYTETGAGNLNLSVNSHVSEELLLGVDGTLVHAVSDQSSITATIGIGYDVIDQDTSITSAFAGASSASFVTQGLNSSPWLMRTGVGIEKKVSETVKISVNYDLEAREDFDNKTASVKVRWMF
ncbi:MAG: outer membrane autotransporter protein [Motiliproteus sp.]